MFEEPVLQNIKGWVMDETGRLSSEDHVLKCGQGSKEASNAEILQTYSTGLLAVCLTGYASIVIVWCVSF